MLPNVLMIVTDQERNWSWLPSSPEWWERHLPNRLRLRNRGLTFNNFHVHTAPCSPSRSVLYTGRHIDETGVYGNVNLPGQDSMSTDIRTIGHMLREVGYRHVAYKGKFHLAKERDLEREGGAPSLREYGFEDWGGRDSEGAGSTEGLDDRFIARQAVDWLEEHRLSPRPWFLAVNFVNPHDINDFPRSGQDVPDYRLPLPTNVDDDLEHKPSIQTWWQHCWYDRKNYIRPEDKRTWSRLLDAYLHYMIEADVQLGKVLDALERSPFVSNTLIVFTSDHGELGGAHTLKTKGPEVYWESKSVPLVIVPPTPTHLRGTVTSCLSSTIDLAPTLLSFAGSDGARFGLRGRDLSPALHATGETTHLVRDAVLYTFRGLETVSCCIPRRNLLGLYTSGPAGEHKFARYYAPDQERGPLSAMELELYDYRDYRGTERPFESLNRAYQPCYEPVVQRLNEQLEALYSREVALPERSEVPLLTRRRPAPPLRRILSPRSSAPSLPALTLTELARRS